MWRFRELSRVGGAEPFMPALTAAMTAAKVAALRRATYP
jgi:hypothetical protein